MNLKRLTLQGYKTFASKTEFVFDEGITAIVGPNGSGKSNIADALRWVLGEQSFSTLRGKRSADMIFSGSQRRPRAGMAQAILTLDNSDGWLPIAYSEVEIGRRAYRSGENEYILNGQKVRLKDILDLLATSGLAERTYTVIGQGLIDQALSIRAEERRALFEEAAGINHYKNKRAETLRRLQETQRNLERVHDILSEIRPRLTSLKRQATRARNYEQIAADLRHLLFIWYGHKWDQAKIRLRAARRAADATEREWRKSRNKLLVHQQNIDSLRQRVNSRQQRLADTLSRRDEIRDQLEKARRDVAILRERQESLARRLQEIEAERPLLESQQKTAVTELEAAAADLDQAQTNLQQQQAGLQQFTVTFKAQQQEINQWQQKLRQSENRQQKSRQQLAQAEGQLSQLRERLQELTTAVAAPEETDHSRELAQADAEIAQHSQAIAAAQSEIDAIREQRQTVHQQRRALIGELKTLRREAKEQSRRLNRQQNEIARLEARVDLLDRMRTKEITIPDDVTLLGPLAGLITIPAEHQTAVAAALASRLTLLVVPDDDNLWPLLEQKGHPRLHAAALSRIQPPPPSQPPAHAALIGRAADLVGGEERLHPLIQRLLGAVWLVADRQAAYNIAADLPAGALAVAPDGFVAHAGGIVDVNGHKAQDEVLAREEEWRQAQAALTEARDKLAQMETAVADQDQIILDKQAAVDALQNEDRSLGRTLDEIEQRQSQAQRQQDRARQQRSFILRRQQEQERQQKAREQEQERLQKRLADLKTGITTHREAIGTAETAVLEARAHLDEMPITESRQQRQSLQQAIDAAQTIVAGRQAVVDSRRATLDQVNKQITRLEERRSALQKQQAQLSLQDEAATQQDLQQRLDQLDAEVKPIRAHLTEDRKKLQEMETAVAGIQRHTLELETQYTQTKVKLTQQENQIEGLMERIKADLGLIALSYDDDQVGPTPLPMSDVVEQLPHVDELPDDIEETIHNYRGQMQRMGAINPDAPAEYEETQHRHDFLTEQIEDLNRTEERLRRVIAELDELTSKAFAKTVEEVNGIFGETFKQLFGGGAARLVLTDPDDLTVSGVDIIARLPHRREQGLGLLSGGERSLTAAALIFSLLKVSPPPFCVMDEVDAALDEANINRFRDLLRELSLKIQFIIITHNRGTVQAAHTLYGISMGDDSASQSISIKPEDYLKQEPLL